MFEVKNNIFEMEIMMSVRIIIDSASDLTKEQADKLGPVSYTHLRAHET